METTKVIAAAEAENTGETYTTRVLVSERQYIVDEPKILGGNDAGAAPAEHVCIALASCKAITLRMYANRKGWKLKMIRVKVHMVNGDNTSSGRNTFLCSIGLTGDLTEEQVKRLLEIARVCPVDRLLSKPSEIVTVLE